MGLQGARHDGNDAETVYKTMRETVESVRAGGLPVLLEYMTHRWREHVGPGTDLEGPFREEGEKEKALAADPLELSRRKLAGLGVSAQESARWTQETTAAVDAAVRFARSEERRVGKECRL